MEEKVTLTDEQKVRVLLGHRALMIAAGNFDNLVGKLKAELKVPADWVLNVDELFFIAPPDQPQVPGKVNGHAATQAPRE